MKWSYHSEIEKYNCRYKYINGELVEIMICSAPIWSNIEPDDNGCQSGARKNVKAKECSNTLVQSNDCSKRSMNRAKKNLFDYVVSNPDMNLFVTLTLNAEKVDRYDYKQIIRKLNQWLDNRVRRNGLKYVLVPELHKDGAIHFHGFFNRVLKLNDSGLKHKNGNPVYNLPDWSLGFTTAIDTDENRERTANYICKYVTKQLENGKIGGRYYLHGGELNTPEYSYGYMFPDEIEGEYSEFEIPDTNLKFRVWKIQQNTQS